MLLLPNTLQRLLTEADEQDRRVDATSASVFPGVAWVPRQREKAAGSVCNKLQLTVRRSVRSKQGVWKSHWGQGHGILPGMKKSTYLNVRQTLAKLPGHARRCLCLTLSGKLLREVLWEPVLQRKRSCCSWTDSGISIPWLTVGTSWRWYTVHVIPVKCDVLIKWASITMFLDTCVYDKQLIFCAAFSSSHFLSLCHRFQSPAPN